MSKHTLKVALNNAKIPWRYTAIPQGILQPDSDVANRVGGDFSGSRESYDYNTLGVLFIENVMPTAEGYHSVGYAQKSMLTPPTDSFDKLFVLRNAASTGAYAPCLFVPAKGKNYIFNNTTTGWVSSNPFAWAPTSDKSKNVTLAEIADRSLVCYSGQESPVVLGKVLEFDVGTSAMVTRVLTLPAGFDMSKILGILNAGNYLVAYTVTTILWSSLVDILNFNDTVNGSGKQIPTALKNSIVCVLPISGGFVIYTAKNAIAAFLTGNPNTPFSFREIEGAGGVSRVEHVAYTQGNNIHYIIGSNGIQLITLQKAENLFPDVLDFLYSGADPQWNTVTKSVSLQNNDHVKNYSIKLITNRYLVISYTSNPFTQFPVTYAASLIYDLNLRRWGRLFVDHTDIFLYPSTEISFETGLPAITKLAILKRDGNILFANFTANNGGLDDLGVVVVGRVKNRRDYLVTLHEVEIQDYNNIGTIDVQVLGALPGSVPSVRSSSITAYKIFATPIPYPTKFLHDKVYENFDLAIIGAFNLANVVVKVSDHGSR